MVNPVTTMFFRIVYSSSLVCSESSREGKDQHDEKNQPKPSAWVVAPAAAIRPGRQRSNEEKHQHNQDDCAHLILHCSGSISSRAYYPQGQRLCHVSRRTREIAKCR